MMPKPKPVTVPDLVCSNLAGQARVSHLIYNDTMSAGSKAQAALSLMRSMQQQKKKAGALGC
eukprot:CAMPEP_0206246854 /NCGR_PEP_ID=MMETSP0047_2-20121206/19492_1 /ASSEMBLY_ACC=CAM_ASM_000192 /TAXON_ID=195065 /ORGANISM="Chroomonas mesostigmatica_cf, Strain CCMP1168" /LENGTH=61 /DNA_ID=CAMNT_0053672327 /DNA_START=42 /DNA_END=227 /DNA_ORIENTATION=-